MEIIHQIGSALVNTSSNFLEYWAVNPTATNGFALGSGSDFTLITEYIAADNRGAVSPSFLEHFVYSPSAPLSGEWYGTNSTVKSDTSITSIENLKVRDFCKLQSRLELLSIVIMPETGIILLLGL